VTEATDAASLNETMTHGSSLIFRNMQPGERKVVGTTRRNGRELPVAYFRDTEETSP
jgi:hypothetical protein